MTCGIQCLADAPTGGDGGGSSITIGGDRGKICTKVNDTEIDCNLNTDNLGGTTTINMPTGSGITIVGTDGYLCTKSGSTSLKCNTPATLGGGDSLWKQTTLGTTIGISVLEPKTTSQSIYFNGGDIYYNATAGLDILAEGFNGVISPIHITNDGTTIGGSHSLLTGNGIGLAVAGHMLVGGLGQSNYVYMYGTGNGNDDNSRYEIFGSRKLAVGTSGGSYIFFMEKTNNNTLRVGLNTTTPQATLDVKGGIRVSDNCEPRGCDSNREGTITYDNDKGFLGCKKVVNGLTTTYKRVSLDGGTWSGTSLPSLLNCTVSSYSSTQQVLTQ